MLQEYREQQEGYQEIIKANLSIFLIELVRNRKTIDPLVEAASYARERLDEFMELISEHLTEHKQVAEYARLMNLSLYRLNAITKTTLGKTCSEVINEQLILESKRYLLATPNQVKEIAYLLGFEDVSYFIRFFRKHTGHSPEAFRQLFK
jgi:AraC-like DNA-binding protein